MSILAVVSHDVECTAPFPDEIDCVKFISISKSTKGTMRLTANLASLLCIYSRLIRAGWLPEYTIL